MVKILAEICDVPFSTITMIDQERQWHKAAFGIGDLRETPRDVAFCAHTILHDGDLMIIPDVTKDARFADNPFVTGDPNLRFYAGAVLRSEEGLPLGTVCVVDYKPRQLDARQQNILRLMAKQVMAQITLRREVAERRLAEKQQQLLIAELHHRVKNALATVQAVIQMSLRRRATSTASAAALANASPWLANTHTLLSERHWDAVSFRELVESELAPYDQAGRLTLQGPDFTLPAQTAVAFGMVLHELTTNASKYGALARDEGKLAVSWTLTTQDGAPWITLQWDERGGPPVSAPAHDELWVDAFCSAFSKASLAAVSASISGQKASVRALARLPGETEMS